ncbi:hypothetical protein SLS56_000371 [Neofusicoccum ribis]|uniref:Secreted protein n=1 Tax=Neofusicoccum ribis TaxID=45134 RepID=A0ABR3TEN1_9PEZI
MLFSFLTGLTAATLALAGPVDLYRRDDWLSVTSVEYSGSGCPEGSLTGEFCPATNSFNVSISEMKAELEDGKSGDHANCHIKVGLRTAASKQVNVLKGDFTGHVYLSSKGMTAYEKNTYSFAGNDGDHEMRWDFDGPVDLDTVFTNELKTTFLSPCGGDFTLQIDNVLMLKRGDDAEDDDDGYIEISRLTGSLGHTLLLEEKDCEAEDDGKSKDDYGKGDGDDDSCDPCDDSGDGGY